VDPNSPILRDIVEELRKAKRMAERAFEQLEDEDFFFRLNGDANSLHVIVKHLAGNMRSRFTDFLTSDGEKPDRDRDSEFVEPDSAGPRPSRQETLAAWERGWAVVFDALAALTDPDLAARPVRVRGEPMSAFAAINRQTAHYSYHVGQIVLLAKHIKLTKGGTWNYLTVPRGESAQFDQAIDARRDPRMKR
jgi:Protein of unknown function (DUF1572)